jgi:hypothetical protein
MADWILPERAGPFVSDGHRSYPIIETFTDADGEVWHLFLRDGRHTAISLIPERPVRLRAVVDVENGRWLVYKKGNRLYGTNCRTGEVQSVAKSTFFKKYLPEARARAKQRKEP